MGIESDIKFPLEDKDWLAKILIGGVISLVPIVNFIALGYYIKTMRNSIDGKPEMPEWKGFGDFFVKGIITFVIFLIYMIIPLIIILVATVTWGLSFRGTAFNPWNIFASTWLIAGLLIAFIVALIIGFLLPMALAMYAKSNDIGDAFKFGELINRIKSVFSEYLTTYAVVILFIILLWIITMIPFIGWIIGIFGSFYIYIVASNMFGKVYAKSVG